MDRRVFLAALALPFVLLATRQGFGAMQGMSPGAFDPDSRRLAWGPSPLVSPAATLMSRERPSRIEPSVGADHLILPYKGRRAERLQVVGARRIRNIGGHTILDSNPGSPIAENYTRIQDEVFIEGKFIDLAACPADGWVAGGSNRHTDSSYTLFPRVYVQNCRVVGINGANAGLHADLFQMDNSADVICFDRITASSNYQGFFMRPIVNGGKYPVRRAIDIRRTNFRRSDIPGDLLPQAFFYFFKNQHEYDATDHMIYLTDCWMEIPENGNPIDYVSPKTQATVGSDGISDYVWWPTLTRIQDLKGRPGKIRIGIPPAGDFVKEADVPLAYTSPGYQSLLGWASPGRVAAE